MKKCIVAIVMAIMCSSVTHAASFIWSVGASGVNVVDATGAPLTSGWAVYIIWDKGADGLNALTAENKSTWLANSGGFVVDSGATKASVGVIANKTNTGITWQTGGGDTVWNGTVLPGQSSGSQTFYALLVDASNLNDANNIFFSTKTVTAPTSASGGLTVAFGSNVPTSSTQWTLVPEPSSMALLAMGVAVLGLRRKFSK